MSPTIRSRQENLDLICEELIDAHWVEFWRTCVMSNDYAFSEANARCTARTLARQLTPSLVKVTP
jgi:hypothetical protein